MNAARGSLGIFLGLLLLGALMLTSGCDEDSITSPRIENKESYEHSTVQSLGLSDVHRVVAGTRNGSISVRAQASTTARLVIRKTVRASTRAEAQQVAALIQVDVQIAEGELAIRSTPPDGWPGVDVEVDYELDCPAEVDLDLDAVNGALSVEDMNGTVAVDLVNGRIDIARSRGSGGAVAVRVVNGIVIVEVPEGGGYDLTATTISGCIIGRLGGSVVNQCRPGIQRVRLGVDDGIPYDLRVVNGTIEINR